MSDIHINIHGGNNQILPNATEGIQNFYGDQFAEKILSANQQNEGLPIEAQKLLHYIDKEQLPQYLSLIGECQSATELAQVVVDMCMQEPKLSKEEIVKERFITLLLPLASKLTKGTSIDNIRARINDALSRLPKQRAK